LELELELSLDVLELCCIWNYVVFGCALSLCSRRADKITVGSVASVSLPTPLAAIGLPT